MSRRLRFSASLIVTAMFMGLLLMHVDLDDVGDTLKNLSPTAVYTALACLFAGYTARIIRWWVMLHVVNADVRLSDCAWPFLVSIAANNLLPFRAGDAIRVLAFRRQLGVPMMRILATVILERLLDFILLAGLFFVLLGLAVQGSLGLDLTALIWVVLGGLALLSGFLCLAPYVHRLLGRVLAKPAIARRSWAGLVDAQGTHFVKVLSLMRSPGMVIRLTVLTLICWAFEGGVFVIVAVSLVPELASGAAPWFALATGTLSTLIPSSPGYFGTFDYFTVLGLQAFGASQNAATAFALAVHLILWLPLTIVGSVYFLLPFGRTVYRRARSRMP